ncbi:MAG: hypothetical protein Q8K60_08360 [Parachlamydiaceae bacterium]|nr:hypothetical protein [Parachlamydiaceae bacterium]
MNRKYNNPLFEIYKISEDLNSILGPLKNDPEKLKKAITPDLLREIKYLTNITHAYLSLSRPKKALATYGYILAKFYQKNALSNSQKTLSSQSKKKLQDRKKMFKSVGGDDKWIPL